MNPPALKFGCQTFTWEMLGDAWSGGPDDLIAAIADGGYAGIEITDRMIGSFAGRAADFARRLDEAGLALVAFAMGSDGGFTESGQAEADLEATRRWVEFAAHFPGAVVSMGSATVMSEGARDDKFAVAAEIYNRAAEIGRMAGVTVAVHPSSHHNTLLFSRADYDRIFGLWSRRSAGCRTPAISFAAGRRSTTRWRRIGTASATCISRTWTRRGPGRCWAKGPATFLR